MTTNPSALKEAFDSRNYGISRLEQISNEMKRKKEEEEKNLMDEPEAIDDFIEEDLEEENLEQETVRQKKANKTTKLIVPIIKKEVVSRPELTDELKKRDIDTKAIMENALKNKLPTDIANKRAMFQEKFAQINKTQMVSQRESAEKLEQKTSNWFSETHFSANVMKKLPESIYSKNELMFFLVDACEGIDDHSCIYLFGKVKHEDSLINTCVQIPNQQREIYIIPKEGKSVEEVQKEVSFFFEKNKKVVDEIKYTSVKRGYCFEFEVDRRNEMMDVLLVNYPYKFSFPSLLPSEGKTYKGVFGHSYTSLELFFIRNKVYGPGWLKLSEFEVLPENQKFSEQLLQLRMNDNGRCFHSVVENIDIPLLDAAVLQIYKDPYSDNSLMAVYISLYRNLKIIDCSYSTVDHILLYVDGFSVESTRPSDSKKKYTDIKYDNEYKLLRDLQNIWAKSNPDVIISHEMYTGVLDFLFAKLNQQAIENLHLCSRLHADPAKFKSAGGRNVQKKAKTVFSGRLLVDTFSLCQEFLKLDDFSINSIISHIRGNQITPPTKQDLELRANSEYLMEIILKQQFLPLTLQLSRVAGCLWSVSLRQARAERNEILLMHKFYERDFIIPDKQGFEKDENDTKKYTGGKVFEPTIGFYDTYIVLVDFNSLYPSIIRHYNICFTTVIRQFKQWTRNINQNTGQKEELDTEKEGENNDEDATNLVLIKPMNDIVVNSSQPPILPGILSMLVKERKNVKNELRHAKTEEKRMQLEAKQLAFKLVANSIYGCLGFSSSRFYCRKMASLVTYFGRHLLESSKALITGLNYSVIYGDTDSLMINTMVTDPLAAIEVGIKVKKEVNEQFKRNRDHGEQILEVELDGVYKKLLLLKKKKYAGLKLLNFMEIAKSTSQIEEKFKLEIKGLDVIRRDWSKVTRDVSNVVLNILMESGDLGKVYSYLEEMNDALDRFHGSEIEKARSEGLNIAGVCKTYKSKEEKVHENGILTDNNEVEADSENKPKEIGIPVVNALRLGDFIIKKQLNKRPSEYGESDQTPHVRVAKWLMTNKGKTEAQLVNHHIPYLIVTRGTSIGEQAMSIDEYDAQINQLNVAYHPVDIDFYKNSQIINPIERLLGPIEGFFSHKLKIIFNLTNPEDDRQVVNNSVQDTNSKIVIVQGQMTYFYRKAGLDKEEFRLKCNYCAGQCYAFMNHCSIDEKSFFTIGQYQNRVLKVLTNLVDEYYSNKKVCKDCKFTTNQSLSKESYCDFHEKRKLKPALSAKELNAKISFFKLLCTKFNESGSSSGQKSELMFSYRKAMDLAFEVIDRKNMYEGKSVLKCFCEYELNMENEMGVEKNMVKLI